MPKFKVDLWFDQEPKLHLGTVIIDAHTAIEALQEAERKIERWLLDHEEGFVEEVSQEP